MKAGWRVEFVCGLRAVRLARREFGVLSRVAGALSVGLGDVPARVTALGEENRAVAKERRVLLEELAEAKAAELLRGSDTGETATAVFSGKPVEFAKRVASTVARAGCVAVVGVIEDGSGAAVLMLPKGDSRNAGSFFREAAAQMDVRGGGSAEMAQGVCGAGQVADLLEKLVARLHGLVTEPGESQGV